LYCNHAFVTFIKKTKQNKTPKKSTSPERVSERVLRPSNAKGLYTDDRQECQTEVKWDRFTTITREYV